MILRLQKTITNYRAMKFFQKLIVIISEWGDPATPMMYHELSVRYLLWVVQIPPICTAY